MPSVTEQKHKRKPSILPCFTFYAVIVSVPVCLFVLLCLGLFIKQYNNSFFVEENVGNSRQFPFLKEGISYAHIGNNVYGEGTASWEEVKFYFNDFVWIPIDAQEGVSVTCYRFHMIHESQTQSAQKTSFEGLWYYYHDLYHGFYAEKTVDKGGKAKIEVYFDLDHNRFFYNFIGRN